MAAAGNNNNNVTCLAEARKKRVADLDEGYTKLANTLIEALATVELSGQQLRVVLAVIRKTYGFHKSNTYITAARLADAIGYQGNVTNIHADLRTLKLRRILVVDEDGNTGINKVMSDWQTNRNPSPNRSKSITAKNKLKSITSTMKKHHSHNENSSQNVMENHHPIKERKKTIKEKDTKHRARAKNNTPVPEPFPITQAMIDWATQNNITTNLQDETDNFVDYHAAKGSLFKDWQRAWQKWMRNTKHYQRPVVRNWQQEQEAKEAKRQRELDAWVRGEDIFSNKDQAIEGEVIDHD